MSRTILIGRNGRLPTVLAKSEVSPTEKKPKGLSENDTVVFRLSAEGHPIAGVVKSIQGSRATVKLALPNYDGLLVCSKDAEVSVAVEDLTPIDAPFKSADVKRWETSSPVKSKAAEEIKDENGVIVDYRDVTFDGFGSTFAETTPEDRDGDNIPQGAFKNLPEFRTNPVMLTDHTRSVSNLMGSYSRIAPNDRGLAVTGNITNSNHPDAVHVRSLVAEGHLKTLSIGGAFFYEDDFMTISEIMLYEISLVVVPANPDAIFQVRGLDVDYAEKAFRHHAKMHGGEVRLKQNSLTK